VWLSQAPHAWRPLACSCPYQALALLAVVCQGDRGATASGERRQVQAHDHVWVPRHGALCAERGRGHRARLLHPVLPGLLNLGQNVNLAPIVVLDVASELLWARSIAQFFLCVCSVRLPCLLPLVVSPYKRLDPWLMQLQEPAAYSLELQFLPDAALSRRSVLSLLVCARGLSLPGRASMLINFSANLYSSLYKLAWFSSLNVPACCSRCA
jgi:hypothetical protein